MAQREGRGTSSGERFVVESRETADGSLELLIADSSVEETESSASAPAAPPEEKVRSTIRAPLLLAAASLIAVVLGAITWVVLRSPGERDADAEEISEFRPYDGTEELASPRRPTDGLAAAPRRAAALEVVAEEEEELPDEEAIDLNREELSMEHVPRVRDTRPLDLEPPGARLIEASEGRDEGALLREVDRRLEIEPEQDRLERSREIRSLSDAQTRALPQLGVADADQPTVVRVGRPQEPASEEANQDEQAIGGEGEFEEGELGTGEFVEEESEQELEE